jgi:hypothetical protein
MELTLCQIGDSRGNNIARRIVENYHSYVPTWDSVGRRIDWVIMLDKEIVGVIGIGSATYPPCKDILTRLGVSKEEYKGIFNNIANNWRFCLIKSVPNLGTMVLKKVREIAPYAWKEKYGDDLKYLITFVGGGRNGAVYKADNWEMIGYTSGLPEHSSVSMKWDSGEELRRKFVKPTGEDRKMIFFKTLKAIKYEPLTLF